LSFLIEIEHVRRIARRLDGGNVIVAVRLAGTRMAPNL